MIPLLHIRLKIMSNKKHYFKPTSTHRLEKETENYLNLSKQNSAISNASKLTLNKTQQNN